MPIAKINARTLSAAVMRGSQLESVQKAFDPASIGELYKKTAETALESPIYVGGDRITFPWKDTAVDSQRGFDVCGKIASASGSTPEESSESAMLPVIMGEIVPCLKKNIYEEAACFEISSDACKVSTRDDEYVPVPVGMPPVIKLQRTDSGWEVEIKFIWENVNPRVFNKALSLQFSTSDKDAWGNKCGKFIYVARIAPPILECMQWDVTRLGRKEGTTFCELLSSAIAVAWANLNKSYVVIEEFDEGDSPQYRKHNFHSRTYKLKGGGSGNVVIQVPTKEQLCQKNKGQGWRLYDSSRFRVPHGNCLTKSTPNKRTENATSLLNTFDMRNAQSLDDLRGRSPGDRFTGMSRYGTGDNVFEMANESPEQNTSMPQTPEGTTLLVRKKKKNALKAFWKKFQRK